jgi:hypothetical protein
MLFIPYLSSAFVPTGWCTGLLVVTTSFAAWAYRRRTAR